MNDIPHPTSSTEYSFALYRPLRLASFALTVSEAVDYRTPDYGGAMAATDQSFVHQSNG